ncbi:MAG TPA: ornithine cyclodeaminase [Lachnospiraceae bacterium]|nr:ornithine cyclodeaminase [Lachnospiraceae bacterium]
MSAKIDFLYLSEPDMIRAGVKDMAACIASMEDMLLLLKKGDYMMGGENHNSHGCMVTFPDDPKFPGMPKNTQDRRFMAMPAYLGGRYQMAGVKWYGSNIENKKKGLPRSILTLTLNDKDTGAPLAFMSANLLSAYRTGGIPGVGAKYLARKDSETAAVIGPGVMGKTSLAAFAAVCPKLHRVKIKGRGRKSIDSFIAFVKKEYPQFDEIIVCETEEEAVRDADVISFTTTAMTDDDPAIVETYPYISGDWVKPGAFISMPSAARFDDEFLGTCKFVVDNRKLYEAWASEYPYPTYPKMGIIGCKFTDLIHEGKASGEDLTDMADIIEGKAEGRTSEDQVIIYSVGGMPVEDVAWGCSVYRREVKEGIGTKLNLWETPEMA